MDYVINSWHWDHLSKGVLVKTLVINIGLNRCRFSSGESRHQLVSPHCLGLNSLVYSIELIYLLTTVWCSSIYELLSLLPCVYICVWHCTLVCCEIIFLLVATCPLGMQWLWKEFICQESLPSSWLFPRLYKFVKFEDHCVYCLVNLCLLNAPEFVTCELQCLADK